MQASTSGRPWCGSEQTQHHALSRARLLSSRHARQRYIGHAEQQPQGQGGSQAPTPTTPSSPMPNPVNDPSGLVYWGGTLPSTRRAVIGGLSGLAIALGGNLGGCSSFLLSLDGGALAERSRLDVLIPVNRGGASYKRCVDYGAEFEFIYPQNWLADLTQAYRAAARAERERSLDLPSLEVIRRRQKNVAEPTAAFGPPGSTGETNVSVIVAPIFTGFTLQSMGTPERMATFFLSTIAPEDSGLNATLLNARARVDAGGATGRQEAQLYYEIEYTVKGPAFFRHNLSVITSRNDLLYTFNAQTPEPGWEALRGDLQRCAASFKLLPAQAKFPSRL